MLFNLQCAFFILGLFDFNATLYMQSFYARVPDLSKSLFD